MVLSPKISRRMARKTAVIGRSDPTTEPEFLCWLMVKSECFVLHCTHLEEEKMCSKVPCPLCLVPSFESIEHLKINLVKVTNRPLVCPICNEILFGLDKLTIHLFSHSMALDQEIYRPRVPDSSNNRVESNLNKEEKVKCEICEFEFENPSLLTMHMNLIHSNTVSTSSSQSSGVAEIFQCHLCYPHKQFKMKGSLRVHLRVVHMHGFQNICKNINNKTKTEQQMGETTGRPTNTIVSVSLDDEASSQISQLLHSSSSVSGNVIIGTSTGQVPVHLNEIHLNGQESKGGQCKSWECDICTKSFTTKYFLKKHKRLHTGEMPYACAICAKTFTFQQSYHKHLLYHSDDKPHVCNVCNRAFKELSTLHNHERIHTGEKPFKCETCGKCFRQRVSYLVHRRIHTGKMPYQCTACAKSFRYKVSQRTHKCPSNGTVVRQSGELLQKLLQNSSIIKPHEEEDPVGRPETNQDLVKCANAQQDTVNDLIDKSIEAIMVKGKMENIGDLFPTPDVVEEIMGIHNRSPSEQFENLCLYSPSTITEQFLNMDPVI